MLLQETAYGAGFFLGIRHDKLVVRTPMCSDGDGRRNVRGPNHHEWIRERSMLSPLKLPFRRCYRGSFSHSLGQSKNLQPRAFPSCHRSPWSLFHPEDAQEESPAPETLQRVAGRESSNCKSRGALLWPCRFCPGGW